MKLMIKEIEKRLPELGSQENVPNPKIIVKFFTPWSNWTWYVVEGEKREDDWLFFGMVHGHEKELGYFRLKQLEGLKGPKMGLRVERDLYFGYGHRLNEFRREKNNMKKITVREKINKLGKKDIEALIETAIAGCEAGFNSSMLKESRNNMLDYLFELDDYTLEQIYLRTF